MVASINESILNDARRREVKKEQLRSRFIRFTLIGICGVCTVVLYSFFPETTEQLIIWLLIGVVGLGAFFAFLASERHRARASHQTSGAASGNDSSTGVDSTVQTPGDSHPNDT